MAKVYTVDTWFERDRANITVYEGDFRNDLDAKEIASWWDEEVAELVDFGFLSPKDFEKSAIEYCKELKLI